MWILLRSPYMCTEKRSQKAVHSRTSSRVTKKCGQSGKRGKFSLILKKINWPLVVKKKNKPFFLWGRTDASVVTMVLICNWFFFVRAQALSWDVKLMWKFFVYLIPGTMSLESTQPLTEMSTRNLPDAKESLPRKRDKLTAICRADCIDKMCEPRRLNTLWASTACYRDSLPLQLLIVLISFT
jgi:hypothetical protein